MAILDGATTAPGAAGQAERLSLETGVTRRPRIGITVNGEVLDGDLIDFAVQNNTFLQADTFKATLRLNELDGQHGLKFWAQQETIEVVLVAGMEVAKVTLLSGRVDDVEIDIGQRRVFIAGRDRTADLIETKTTEKWPNRTASEIAKLLAERHGLTPVVTDTTTRAGTFYQREHAQLADDTTEWNLLTYLAEQEGFEVYVEGRSLVFGPPADESTAPRWVLKYRPMTKANPIPAVDAKGLLLRRNLTVARDIVVRVVSWNARDKRAISVERRADRTRRPQPGRNLPPQTYVIRRPQMTEQQAIELAEQKLREFSRFARSIDAGGIPADLNLTRRHLLEVRGTGSEFDTTYRLDAIMWTYGAGEGLTMRLRARNLAPTSTASL